LLARVADLTIMSKSLFPSAVSIKNVLCGGEPDFVGDLLRRP
jgi:hypothetical protein